MSIGCPAVGDEAAEDLFVLVARADRERAEVVVAPHAFRGAATPAPPPGAPAWLAAPYRDLAVALARFPRPPDSTAAR